MGCDLDSVHVTWGRKDWRAFFWGGGERKWKNRVSQNAGISSLDEKILASGEGLCSVDFSLLFFFTFDSRANEGNLYVVRHIF